ncbi:hypothetical protein BF49_2907 [Bradyrhizobium sp.]|nr:hypothetical protein BF49_2907 [Bradyrhizobium sp.]
MAHEFKEAADAGMKSDTVASMIVIAAIRTKDSSLPLS